MQSHEKHFNRRNASDVKRRKLVALEERVANFLVETLYQYRHLRRRLWTGAARPPWRANSVKKNIAGRCG